MGVIGWIMLVVHVCLFVYLRKTITKKKRILELENARICIENSQLKIKNESILKMLDNRYENE